MIKKSILKQCYQEGFTEEDVYSAYKIFFGTLFSESRLNIINLLRKRKENVSGIMSALDMEQTAVSHDLARLKRCNFVEAEIIGKFRYYRLNNETIKPIMGLIDRHMSNCCIKILKNKGGDK